MPSGVYIRTVENRRKNSESKIGHIVTEETRSKISKANTGLLLGRKLSEEHKRKVSESLKGHKAWNKGFSTPKHVREKISKALKGRATKGIGWHHSEKYRQEKSICYLGTKSHFWKGGLTNANKKIRNGVDFFLWREKVFARDNWTCQKCGRRDGGELHPHHIKSFAEYPELRFEVSNGITLCKDCHLKEHRHHFGRALVNLRKP